MMGDRARSELSGSRFGPLTWVATTGSTNRDLLVRARRGAPEGEVLVADHQTSGRGRLGRRWEAPPSSSLLCSVLLRPRLDAGELHLVTMAVGVAAVRAVEAVAGVSPGLKWPNDLVADTEAGERKLAGILAEAELEGAGPAAVVVGLGLNVSWPDELPADLATIATSLHHLTDRPVDREDLLVRILLGFDDRYGRLDESGGRVGLREEYAELCRTLGRPVRVESRTGSLEGRAVDLTPEGHLVMETVDGRHEVTAGDVRHLRPA